MPFPLRRTGTHCTMYGACCIFALVIKNGLKFSEDKHKLSPPAQPWFECWTDTCDGQAIVSRGNSDIGENGETWDLTTTRPDREILKDFRNFSLMDPKLEHWAHNSLLLLLLLLLLPTLAFLLFAVRCKYRNLNWPNRSRALPLWTPGTEGTNAPLALE